MTVDNFRPNLVVEGGVAHQEDLWQWIDLLHAKEEKGEKDEELASSSGLRLKVTGPCARCSMVNVDHQSAFKQVTHRHGDGSSSSSPAACSNDAFVAPVLKTLASYRREKSNIYFGQFLAFDDVYGLKSAAAGDGWLRTGMRVKTCRHSEAVVAIETTSP